MRVGAPRVSALQPGGQGGELRDRGGPEPEGTVHVHPGAVGLGNRYCLLEGVKGARVQVARLQADQQRDTG